MGVVESKLYIQTLACGEKTGSNQIFQDLAIWSKISGFVILIDFIFQTEKTVKRKLSGFGASHSSLKLFSQKMFHNSLVCKDLFFEF